MFGPTGRLGVLYGTWPYAPGIPNITIRMLLQHLGGGWNNDGNDPTNRELAKPAPDLVSWTLDNMPLMAPPGTAFNYSNFGYCVLGVLIEVVTGQTYENWVRANILAPCGITDMVITGNTAPERRWPEAMYWGMDGEHAYGMNLARAHGGGGWLATTEDVLRFSLRVDGNAAPPDILQNGSITQMTTASAVAPAYACGWWVNGAGWRELNGVLPGALAVLNCESTGHQWAAVCNTGKGGSPIMDQFKRETARIDALV